MKTPRGAPLKTVDEYLAGVPDDMRAAFEKLRKTIKAAAPGAEEFVSYGILGLRHHGMLFHYAAFKDHCSLFALSEGVRRKFAAELKPFTAGRGTLRFTPQNPIPMALVTRIVKVRVAENEAGAAAERRTGARAERGKNR